ncbi:MAG TPA: PAS domain-containing sensor histidine kinase [Flavobacterium sp.]|uniref:PAS domain-containing sensor histidine kinase n=1 Tax=Flavobacterium sp. TaxID=239 RepID=UPI002CAEF069|nr:PAS domain-containing sensor histidine kinase [Flavobacterium sp.]HNP33538.1 PAS domain-containing sensor histidine kinase [Flavobacterium sp.]
MKNSELLNAIVQNAIDGIISINGEGIVQSINPSGCKLFGYLPEEVIGNNISILMPMPDSLQHDHYIRRYHVTHKPRIIGIGREVTGLKRDGTTFPMRLGVSEVKYNEEVFYVGFIHDLTQHKEIEERLKDYTLHLEELVEVRTQSLNDTILALEIAKEQISNSLESEKELNQLKSRFISMASHEFRTPLSTIQLSASLIEKYAETAGVAEIAKHVNKVKSSVTGLTAILNNFLQIEKLESGKVEAQLTEFDLKELATEVSEEMQSLAKPNQNIDYQNLTEQSIVKLDKNLIKNCIINLITNAIKYSNEGALIEFRTEITPKKYVISVKDNGIGIPLEDQKYLFGAFFRANNTGNILGTGLGLNIVARYVELMNGNITFESNPNKGTLFTLTFPVA